MQFIPPTGDFQKRRGANLPHWDYPGATYFITFRLADSLPQGVLESLILERDEFLEIVRKKRDEKAAEQIERDYQKKLHAFLDRGFGEAWMKNPNAAECVAGALKHFAGNRYDLWAWCVMPNHVHVVVQPIAPHTRSEILHSWRSFTANKINQIVGRTGNLWQYEPFDHVVRNGDKLKKFIRYTVDNPIKAGLKSWPWVWGIDLDAMEK